MKLKISSVGAVGIGMVVSGILTGHSALGAGLSEVKLLDLPTYQDNRDQPIRLVLRDLAPMTFEDFQGPQREKKSGSRLSRGKLSCDFTWLDPQAETTPNKVQLAAKELYLADKMQVTGWNNQQAACPTLFFTEKVEEAYFLVPAVRLTCCDTINPESSPNLTVADFRRLFDWVPYFAPSLRSAF